MKQRIHAGAKVSVAVIAVLLLLPVAVSASPLAGFASNVTAGSIPLSVRFTDASMNSPTEWIWSFGDGETSVEQNPSHTYTRAGTYTVTLAATNAGGSSTVTKPEYITAARPVIAPVASFVSNVTAGTEPLAVQFLDVSTNAPALSVWTFGDGSIFTGSSPLHVYTGAGIYTVTLTATNAAGSNSVTRTGYITVNAPATDAPVAGFVSTANTGTAPRTVQFIDASTNFPVSWSWAFGDGMTSTAQNPQHTYTRIGTYNVTLTATNAWGNNTITRDNYITVTSPVPEALFTATPVSGTAPLAVQFTDTSTNSPSFWDWNFGDGSSSGIQNPAYVYKVPGRYTVSLSAINAAGRGTVVRSDFITVLVSSPPVASFTSDIRKGASPLTVRFLDTSTNTPDSWAWSFGDGAVSAVKNPSHSYMSGGSYTVTLTATNAGGSNTSAMSNYIIVTGPIGTAAVTQEPEPAVPTGSSYAYPEVTVTRAVQSKGSAPVISPPGIPSGTSLLILILAPLAIAGAGIIWWMTRSPKGFRRQRGRDL